MEMILLRYDGRNGVPAVTRLSDPTRGLRWTAPGQVKPVPRLDAEHLLRMGGGFEQCLTLAAAAAKSSEEAVKAAMEQDALTTARGPDDSTVIVLDRSTRSALAGLAKKPNRAKKGKKA